MTWGDAVLLRIHLGSTDQFSGERAFNWVIQQARHAGLRGATVIQGIAGFGPDGVMRQATLFHLTQNLPVTVELVDEEPTIDRFLQGVTPHLPAAALVTTQPVQALWRRP